MSCYRAHTATTTVFSIATTAVQKEVPRGKATTTVFYEWKPVSIHNHSDKLRVVIWSLRFVSWEYFSFSFFWYLDRVASLFLISDIACSVLLPVKVFLEAFLRARKIDFLKKANCGRKNLWGWEKFERKFRRKNPRKVSKIFFYNWKLKKTKQNRNKWEC